MIEVLNGTQETVIYRNLEGIRLYHNRQNVYGSKKKANLFDKRGTLNERGGQAGKHYRAGV